MSGRQKDCGRKSGPLYRINRLIHDTETRPFPSHFPACPGDLRPACPQACRRLFRKPRDIHQGDDRPDIVRTGGRLYRRWSLHLQGHPLCPGGAVPAGRGSRALDGSPLQPGIRSHLSAGQADRLVFRRPGLLHALGRRFPRRRLPPGECLDRRNQRRREAPRDGVAPRRRFPRRLRPGTHFLRRD